MENIYRFLIVLAFLLVGYLFGSIPFGVIISKLFYHKDPRDYGSKNTGGSNVGRSFSRFAGCLTIVLDAAKVLLPFIGAYCLLRFYEPLYLFLENTTSSNYIVYSWYGLGNSLSQLCLYIVPFGGFLGHAYSIFLKFKGGKIVSSFVAMMLFTSYTTIIIFIPLFFIVLKKTKYVSLSSIVFSFSYAVFSWIIYFLFLILDCDPTIPSYLMMFNIGPTISIYFPILATFGAIFIIVRHKNNIKRIEEGVESKVKWIDELGNKK